LGVTALSVEARYLEPELPDELDDAYAQTFDRLRRMFRARGCSQEEAADLAQEAAIRAWMHIRRWGVADSGLDPLLNRIARNLLIDRYRRVTPHLVPLDSAEEIQDHTQDPSEEVARRQRRSAVRSAISSLPTRHQTAITYSLSGLSPEEVGKQMGIGRNAADALLHRARRSLREHLAPVRDGMWALAFGARVRWDRFTRRSGLNNMTPAELTNTLNATVGVAAAAIVTVVALAAGGSGAGAATSSGAFHARVPAVAVARVTRTGSVSSVGAGSSSGGSVGGGTGGRIVYGNSNLGGSWSRDGIDAQANGPKDNHGRRIFGIHIGLVRDNTQPYFNDDLSALRSKCGTLCANALGER